MIGTETNFVHETGNFNLDVHIAKKGRWRTLFITQSSFRAKPTSTKIYNYQEISHFNITLENIT